MSQQDQHRDRSGKITDEEYRHLTGQDETQSRGMHQNRGRNAAANRNEGYMEDVWRQSVEIPEPQRRQPSYNRETTGSGTGLGAADFNRNQTVGAYNDRSGSGQNRQQQTPDYRGRGPKGYRRSDQQVLEDVCESLSEDPYVDASEVTVTCTAGQVTLEGTVPDRRMKYRAEDLVDECRGVQEIHNRLRVVTEQARH